MTDKKILLSEDGYPNAPDIKARLRDPEMESHESQSYVVWTLVDDCLLDDAAAHIEQLERDLAEARKDAERADWLIRMISGKELRRIGIAFGSLSDILPAIDVAMKDKP